ncbi:MAG TPA: cytochrome c biogenesis CcdA family protein [Candidatus Nanoarchaeia archaeon]|nr:cytochrome c biogenesis CcdA family protein [Candidatus Nanoarchaeia archaeon]
MIDHQNSLAQNVTFLIAFVIGFLSFTSPCGFVLISAFFTYAFKERKKALWMSIVFSAGMILAFAIVGLIAGFLHDIFNPYKAYLAFFSGLLLICFAYLMLNGKGFGGMSFKLDAGKNKTFWGVFTLGMLFAFGWTPCVGPVLSGIILMAANTASLAKSILLLATYGLGATLPLIILSYFSDAFDWARTWRSKPVTVFGKKYMRYNLISAVILFLLGLIMITEQGTQFFQRNLPVWIGWSMDFWMELGDQLMNSTWTQGWANWVGGLIALIVIGTLIYLLKRRK